MHLVLQTVKKNVKPEYAYLKQVLDHVNADKG